jgi:glutamine amidotransferase
MCRLFGFRSVIPSQVHSSLIAAENALGTQSNAHPDGWGVAYYVDGSPHVTKSPSTALGDQLFHRLSGVVSSETVVAHVRKATQGDNSVLNCHPFQYGRWVFAHNGDIPGFAALRGRLLQEVSPRLRRFVLGETDSEVIFFILLTQLEQFGPLSRRHALDDLLASLKRTHQAVHAVVGSEALPEPCAQGAEPSGPLVTLLVTDGESLAALHKRSCPERDVCPSLSPECEAPSATGFVNHFIVSSEPLQGDNVWHALGPGEIVGVDGRMRSVRTHVDQVSLPIVA